MESKLKVWPSCENASSARRDQPQHSLSGDSRGLEEQERHSRVGQAGLSSLHAARTPICQPGPCEADGISQPSGKQPHQSPIKSLAAPMSQSNAVN